MANKTVPGVEFLQHPIEGVSVVIPCKNEEGAVGQTVEEVAQALDSTGLDYEVIVVDDGSTDATRTNAVEAGARVVSHGMNLGYGNAVMTGIARANYPVIAMLDADGTYLASDLPRMLDEARRYDMVIGKRTWNNNNTSLLGRVFRKLLYYVILYFTNTKAPDYNSGLRVFHQHDILKYRGILCPKFSFTTSLTLIFLLTFKSVLFLPTEYKPRIGRSHVRYFRDALMTFSYIFVIVNMFQAYRLSLFVIGVGIFLNAFVWLLAVLAELSAATQVGLHLTACLVIVVGALAMNTYASARSCLGSLKVSEACAPRGDE